MFNIRHIMRPIPNPATQPLSLRLRHHDRILVRSACGVATLVDCCVRVSDIEPRSISDTPVFNTGHFMRPVMNPPPNPSMLGSLRLRRCDHCPTFAPPAASRTLLCWVLSACGITNLAFVPPAASRTLLCWVRSAYGVANLAMLGSLLPSASRPLPHVRSACGIANLLTLGFGPARARFDLCGGERSK